MRETKQKKILRETITKQDSFFDADFLNKKLNLGIATIYRFLKGMVDKGELHSYICNGRKVYSHNKSNHVHFTCGNCKKTTHLNVKNLDFLDLEEEICHFQIDMTGTCKSCLKQR